MIVSGRALARVVAGAVVRAGALARAAASVVARASALAAAVALLTLAGCGSRTEAPSESGIPAALLLEARPIGHGARFHPPATGPLIGRCSERLGPRTAAHLEVFAANRVVIVAAGIGTLAPRTVSAGRISGARCYGDVVTVEPTGVVLVRAGTERSVADVFHGWGQTLSSTELAGFSAPRGTTVTAFVNGRRWRGAPGSIPLSRHAEIVLEVGPFVPPHRSYTFPPGA